MVKYGVRKAMNGQFWWMLKTANGETVLTSEPYTTKQNCLAGVTSSKVNVTDRNFSRLTSVRNELYFTQIASNYHTLGTSEMYSSTYSRDAGIESVKWNAPIAAIEDLN